MKTTDGLAEITNVTPPTSQSEMETDDAAVSLNTARAFL